MVRLRLRKRRTESNDHHVVDIVRPLGQAVSDSEIVSILNRFRLKTGKGKYVGGSPLANPSALL